MDGGAVAMMAGRSLKLGVALMLLGGATAGAAQPLNEAVLRYRAEQRVCAEAHRDRVANACDARCLAAADTQRRQCLAVSETRYRDFLRRAMRARR